MILLNSNKFYKEHDVIEDIILHCTYHGCLLKLHIS